MIKTLRRKFITVAMISIAVVLLAIIGSINVINYVNVNRSSDERLNMLVENGGSFEDIKRKIGQEKKDSQDESAAEATDSSKDSGQSEKLTPPDDKKFGGNTSMETPFDSRYFTVTYDADGNITDISTESIAAVDAYQAEEYASYIISKNKKSGYMDCYKYKLVDTRDDDGNDVTMCIFLDCNRELSTFKTFLLASGGISLLGLGLVFILVYFLSGRIMKPVAESYEKQKHFITDASHEIKTPLTIIDANTEVLEMMSGESEWTKSIRNQIKRLTELTNKLVFLSRMDEESTKLIMLDFSISDAVTETAASFEAVAAAAGKKLEINVQKNVTYHGDEGAIRQLVSLLVDNALKYSSEGGQIRVNMRTAGKSSIISVYNTVDQIEVGSHDEFFERFYREDSSRNQATGGHGIGLSVARAIVNAHKGKITAKSEDEHSVTIKAQL